MLGRHLGLRARSNSRRQDPQTPTLRLHSTTPSHPGTQQRWCRGKPIQDACQCPACVQSTPAKRCRQQTNGHQKTQRRGKRGVCCLGPSTAARSNVHHCLGFGRPSRSSPHIERVHRIEHLGFARCMAPPSAPIRTTLLRSPRNPRPHTRSTSFFSWCESEKESVGREQFMMQTGPKALVSMHFAS